jgi:hypothetical protein
VLHFDKHSFPVIEPKGDQHSVVVEVGELLPRGLGLLSRQKRQLIVTVEMDLERLSTEVGALEQALRDIALSPAAARKVGNQSRPENTMADAAGRRPGRLPLAKPIVVFKRERAIMTNEGKGVRRYHFSRRKLLLAGSTAAAASALVRQALSKPRKRKRARLPRCLRRTAKHPGHLRASRLPTEVLAASASTPRSAAQAPWVAATFGTQAKATVGLHRTMRQGGPRLNRGYPQV